MLAKLTNGPSLLLVFDHVIFDNRDRILFHGRFGKALGFLFVERSSRLPQGSQSATAFQYAEFQNPIRFRLEGFDINVPLNDLIHSLVGIEAQKNISFGSVGSNRAEHDKTRPHRRDSPPNRITYKAHRRSLTWSIGQDCRVQISVSSLKESRLKPRKRNSDLEIEFLSRVDGKRLVLIGFSFTNTNTENGNNKQITSLVRQFPRYRTCVDDFFRWIAAFSRTQRVVGLHNVGRVDGRKVGPVDPIVVGDPTAAPHAVHAAIEDLKVDVFSLPVAIHPQDDEIHTLGLVLQMRHDGPLARLALDRGVKELGRIHCRTTIRISRSVVHRETPIDQQVSEGEKCVVSIDTDFSDVFFRSEQKLLSTKKAVSTALTGFPGLVFLWKVDRKDVTRDRSDPVGNLKRENEQPKY